MSDGLFSLVVKHQESYSSPQPNTKTAEPDRNKFAAQSKSKSKRVRTTFTDEQIAILQTNFQIDSNPDGQDLERIALITGLSKRVTQVWFQVRHEIARLLRPCRILALDRRNTK